MHVRCHATRVGAARSGRGPIGKKCFRNETLGAIFVSLPSFRAITRHHDSNPIDFIGGICPRLSDSTGVCRKGTGTGRGSKGAPPNASVAAAFIVSGGSLATSSVAVLLAFTAMREGSSFRIRISQDCRFWGDFKSFARHRCWPGTARRRTRSSAYVHRHHLAATNGGYGRKRQSTRAWEWPLDFGNGRCFRGNPNDGKGSFSDIRNARQDA